MTKSHTHTKHGSHYIAHQQVNPGHNMHADHASSNHKAEDHHMHANHGNSGQAAYLNHPSPAHKKNLDASQNFSNMMLEANKSYSDAFSQIIETTTTGLNEIFQALMQYMQNMTELSAAAYQAAVNANSIDEIAKIQNTYAKTSVEISHEHSARIAQAALQTANDASKPLQQHATETIKRFNHV